MSPSMQLKIIKWALLLQLKITEASSTHIPSSLHILTQLAWFYVPELLTISFMTLGLRETSIK